MHRLTRQVRFAINSPQSPAATGQIAPSFNSFAGYPALSGFGQYLALQVTVAGQLDPQSQYLLDIKRIDAAVREAIPMISAAVKDEHGGRPARLLGELLCFLRGHLQPNSISLESISLSLSPFLSVSLCSSELPMTRLSQKFEFSASHRLHNPKLGDEENRHLFGKCNNPMGHGHNYELQVTIKGQADADSGMVMKVEDLERIVAQRVIDRFDHRNLNAELSEFAQVIPSVENIAKVIYEILKPALRTEQAQLASVTVWETPKTWCEFGEG